MAHIGEKIRQRRIEKGFTLTTLAKGANVSSGYLSSLESGDKQMPSAEILLRIAKELGTTINDLLGEADAPDRGEVVDIPASLAQFAQEADLTAADVEMLARIEYRGKRPDAVDDWRFIYEAIRRTLR